MYDSTTAVAVGLDVHARSIRLAAVRADELLEERTLPYARRKWLAEQRFEFVARQQTFATYVHAVDLVAARIEQLERAIRETAEQEPWRALVARLRCLRGIDTLTALAIVAEIGDFGRFKTAEEFMAFVGLVPSEHSSGEKRRQGSITKVGNSHVRRLLVESAWHARRRPKVGYELAPPPTRPRRGRGRARLPLPAAPLPALAADGRPRQTAAEDRCRLRPRTRRLRLGDRDRATTPQQLSPGASRPRAADASDHTENPRRLYAAPPAGDPRP